VPKPRLANQRSKILLANRKSAGIKDGQYSAFRFDFKPASLKMYDAVFRKCASIQFFQKLDKNMFNAIFKICILLILAGDA